MSKIASEITLTGLRIDKSLSIAMHIQLYENIRQAILIGRLRAGQKLPSSRTISEDLAVSRNTVSLAFEQLIAEGYVYGKVGSGTYVASQLPEKLLHIKKTKDNRKPVNYSAKSYAHSQYGLSEDLMKRNTTSEKIVPFQTAIPAFDAFPYPVWAKIAAKVYRGLSSLQLGYGDAAGYMPLREAIAGYLRSARAVNCEAENILIISGSQQGLNLIAKILLNPGEEAWIEDPGYHGARAALINAGIKLCPVPVNRNGIDIEYGIKHFPKAKLAYLTPSHQYPLGGTIPIPNRLQLIEWTYKNNLWILEDDYDSEFRYRGRPLASMQGLDKYNRVIYLGTFSKVLFPALRVGYLVLPTPELMDTFSSAKAMTDRQNPVVEQAILADFINEGHFGRHLRRMRMLYSKRQEIFLQAAETQLAGLLEIESVDAGMHLIGWLNEKINEQEASAKAAIYGVIAHPVSDYAIQHFTRPGLLLGYTSFDEKTTRDSIHQLALALKSLL